MTGKAEKTASVTQSTEACQGSAEIPAAPQTTGAGPVQAIEPGSEWWSLRNLKVVRVRIVARVGNQASTITDGQAEWWCHNWDLFAFRIAAVEVAKARIRYRLAEVEKTLLNATSRGVELSGMLAELEADKCTE